MPQGRLGFKVVRTDRGWKPLPLFLTNYKVNPTMSTINGGSGISPR